MGERRKHGIVTLDVESTPVFENGLPGKLSKEFQAKAAHASDWASYFPDRAWLAEQLASAEKSKGGAPVLFRPHEDRGWYFKRCLANIDLLTSAAKSGSIEVAIIHACELGRLMTEMEMKFNDFELGRSVEQLALSGQKVAAGGRQVVKDERGASVLTRSRSISPMGSRPRRRYLWSHRRTE